MKMQYTSKLYNTMEHTAMQCNKMQDTTHDNAICFHKICNILKCNTTVYNTLQYNTTKCTGMQRKISHAKIHKSADRHKTTAWKCNTEWRLNFQLNCVRTSNCKFSMSKFLILLNGYTAWKHTPSRFRPKMLQEDDCLNSI